MANRAPAGEFKLKGCGFESHCCRVIPKTVLYKIGTMARPAVVGDIESLWLWNGPLLVGVAPSSEVIPHPPGDRKRYKSNLGLTVSEYCQT